MENQELIDALNRIQSSVDDNGNELNNISSTLDEILKVLKSIKSRMN